ncbi:MAG: enoyl-CoA hydratase-related protein [Bacteroidota bacterium]|nr:enoyl-CoA hydratase-related protein [Bacteroidota bacterium]
MTFNNLLYSVENGICTISINRPDKLNALNLETLGEIKKAVSAAIDAGEIRGIILTGTGQKAFAAGADIAEFSAFTEMEAYEMSKSGHGIFELIEESPKPVLAAVNGFALGGGCELAMACHLRIAATGARFGQPEVSLGTIPGYGGTQRLIRLIGRTKATELLLTGDMIQAQEAVHLGLVNQVTEPELLMESARKMMEKIISKSPLVIAQILALTNTYYEEGKHGFEKEMQAFARSFTTGDFKEGVSAFLEKRKAQFKGE